MTGQVHHLLARQMQAACADRGAAPSEISKLLELVSSAYEAADQERRRADRASRLMAEELDAVVSSLQRQNLRFAAALDNMSHGICMLDEHGNLLVCNNRLVEMFGLQDPKPGTPMEALLRESLTLRHPSDPQAASLVLRNHERLVAGATHETLFQALPDGRTLCVTHAPMDDGGCVQTFEDITARLAAEQQAHKLALHDALTGLPNRTLFRERMETAVTAATERGEKIALLCLDLDHFKDVNDTLGHAAGDELLQIFVKRISRYLRATDTFARLGGDEFAIILHGVAVPADAAVLAQRVIAAVAPAFHVGGDEVHVGVSIGIVLFGAAAAHDEPARLLRCGDLALYRAKAEGRNRFHFFESDMEVRLRARKSLERDLRLALGRDELYLQYQPQFDIKSGIMCGVEALIRWRHPVHGEIAPSAFITIAEESSLIMPLGDWVLNRACAQAKLWPDLTIAVNLSPVQVRHKQFPHMVERILAKTGLPAVRLELEITEGVLLRDGGATLPSLRRLAGHGVKIAMDDFGTGYSSLAYLLRFPFTKLKIDRCFITGLEGDSSSAAIVQAILALGRGLNMRVTAEGIETERQFDLLSRAGCDEAQGYWLAKPMSALSISKILACGPMRTQLGVWRA
jgi:diguanylate cyclase (GGDEF)-like protein/PAS domain S-box-containing protein